MTEALPLLRRSLGDSWRSLIGWSLGVIAALALYLPLFPTIGGDPQFQALLKSLPPALIQSLNYENIASGPGYVQSTFYGLLGFVIIVIAATSWGAAAIAGDEESGSLELTLAHGVTRTQVVLERTAGIVLRLLWLTVLSVLLVLAFTPSAQLDIDGAHLLAAAAAWLGLGLLSATLGLAVGALTGRRVYATAAAAGIAVLGYALNAVANQSHDLDGLHAWSPYAWAFGNNPLIDGADWGGLGLLYGVSAALVLVAVAGLNRRDLSS